MDVCGVRIEKEYAYKKFWKLVKGPYHICKREPYDMYRRCAPLVKETYTNVKEAQMIGGRHIHPESGHL